MAKKINVRAVLKALRRLRNTIGNPEQAGSRKTHFHTNEGVKEIEVSCPGVLPSVIVDIDADALRSLLTPSNPDYAGREPSSDLNEWAAVLNEVWEHLSAPHIGHHAVRSERDNWLVLLDEAIRDIKECFL